MELAKSNPYLNDLESGKVDSTDLDSQNISVSIRNDKVMHKRPTMGLITLKKHNIFNPSLTSSMTAGKLSSYQTIVNSIDQNRSQKIHILKEMNTNEQKDELTQNAHSFAFETSFYLLQIIYMI